MIKPHDPYEGWQLPETAELGGKTVQRTYDTRKPVQEYLEERNLPDLMTMRSGERVTAENWPIRRKELLDTLCTYGYGILPEAPECVHGEIVFDSDTVRYCDTVKSCAGKATFQRIELSFTLKNGSFSFPVQLIRPIYTKTPPPVLLYLSFSPSLKSLPPSSELCAPYIPVEEIIDRGFALAVFCYHDVIADSPKNNFTDGIGKLFFKNAEAAERPADAPGKITLWAYAASRVLDYLKTREDVDSDCVSVVGHSRLGKTALWTGGTDERFFCACVNGSGYAGAGLIRGAFEQRLRALNENGNIDWFCRKITEYLGKEEEIPFDAHWMLALAAPRFISLCCADGDYPQYQLGDYLSGFAAGPAFTVQGVPGLTAPDTPPRPYAVYHEGHIGYSLRPGSHYMSRWDWNAHMDFIERHRNEQ